jgi:prevent-host-death family protein
MKSSSIRELKDNLSELLEKVEKGDSIIITNHNRPMAMLTGITGRHLVVGKYIGKPGIVPLGQQMTKGRYLDAIEDDKGIR